MKSKKFVLISIAVAFFLIVLLSCMTLFSLRKIDTKFAVSEGFNTQEVQEVLDEFKGKNLMFLDVDDVKAQLEQFHYIETVSIEKDYPNVLKIDLKERREVYCLTVDESSYLTDEDGFVLTTVDMSSVESRRDLIKINLTGVSVTDIKVGAIIATDSLELMTAMFDMAKAANLTDCIKEINVIKHAVNELGDVELLTHTGVIICVQKPEIEGVNKITAAFKVYDEQVSDYEKAFNKLFVSKNVESGEIQVTWSDNNQAEE